MESKFKRGVSLIHNFDDKSLWYSVQCDCGDKECGSIIEIEVDDEFDLIQLHFYQDMFFDSWRYDGSILGNIKGFLYRVKKSLILLFTGRLKMYNDFVLVDKDHINNFIEALQEGRDIVTTKKSN